MAKVIRELNLDVSDENRYEALIVKQYDANSRFIKATILNKGEKISIPQTASVQIHVKRSDHQSKAFAGEINNDGTVTVPLTNWSLALDGPVECDICTIQGDEKLTTCSFTLDVKPAAYGDSDVSEDDQDLILSLIETVNTEINKMKQADKYGFVDVTATYNQIVTGGEWAFAYTGGSTSALNEIGRMRVTFNNIPAGSDTSAVKIQNAETYLSYEVKKPSGDPLTFKDLRAQNVRFLMYNETDNCFTCDLLNSEVVYGTGLSVSNTGVVSANNDRLKPYTATISDNIITVPDGTPANANAIVALSIPATNTAGILQLKTESVAVGNAVSIVAYDRDTVITSFPANAVNPKIPVFVLYNNSLKKFIWLNYDSSIKGVKCSGTSLSVADDGTVNIPKAGAGLFGLVKVATTNDKGYGVYTDNGQLKADNSVVRKLNKVTTLPSILAVGNHYKLSATAALTLTLPDTATDGDVIEVEYFNAGTASIKAQWCTAGFAETPTQSPILSNNFSTGHYMTCAVGALHRARCEWSTLAGKWTVDVETLKIASK